MFFIYKYITTIFNLGIFFYRFKEIVCFWFCFDNNCNYMSMLFKAKIERLLFDAFFDSNFEHYASSGQRVNRHLPSLLPSVFFLI